LATEALQPLPLVELPIASLIIGTEPAWFSQPFAGLQAQVLSDSILSETFWF
jgi:hypothetical protein